MMDSSCGSHRFLSITLFKKQLEERTPPFPKVKQMVFNKAISIISFLYYNELMTLDNPNGEGRYRKMINSSYIWDIVQAPEPVSTASFKTSHIKLQLYSNQQLVLSSELKSDLQDTVD